MSKIHHIAVVLPMWLEYSTSLLEGTRAYAREHQDFKLVVFPQQKYGKSPVPKDMKAFSGLLVCANTSDQWVVDLWNSGSPVVNCSGDLKSSGIPSVTPESLYEKVIDYFSKMGLKNLALICPDTQKNSGYQRMIDRFNLAVKSRGLTPHVCSQILIDPGDFPSRLYEADQETALGDFLEQLSKPTGIWCVHDEMANLVCEVAHLRKIAVPQSLSVLGVNNSRVARFADPPISSVPLPGESVGYMAIKMLHQIALGHHIPPEQQQLRIPTPPIKERSSTKLTGNDRTLQQARDIILSRACDGITINEIVECVPMCRMTFHNHYKAAYGCTLGEELRSTRLDAAKHFLSSSEMSITQISNACGFNEPSKFYIFFKRESGVSPTQWRSLHK